MGLRVYSDVNLHGNILKATIYENVGGGTGSAGTDDFGNSYDNKRTWEVPDGKGSWVMPGISGDADSDYWVELRQEYSGSGPEPEINKFILDVPAEDSVVIFYDEDPTLISGSGLTAKDKSLFWDSDADWSNAKAKSNVLHGDDAEFNPWTETTDITNLNWHLGTRYTGSSKEHYYEGDMDELRIFDTVLSEYDIYATEQMSKGSNGIPLVDPSVVNNGGIIRFSMDDSDVEGGTILDTWGSNDGTINGATTGQDGIALTESFDFATTDNISTSYLPTFGSGDFSVSFWFKTSTIGSTAEAVVATYGSEKNGFICGFNNNSYRFWTNSENIEPGSPPSDQWTHVVYVRRNGTKYIYENAVQIGSQGSNNSVNTSNDTLTVGTRESGNYGYDGKLDEVRIYDRGLTDSEVQSLYQYTGPEGVARYQMDDISGSTLTDSWSNYDGTIYGATLVSGGSPDITDYLSFDGDDYVEFENQLPIQKDLTFSANIYWDGTDRGFIYAGELNGSASEFQLLIDASGDVQWRIKEMDGPGILNTSHSINPDQWYHITGIADSFNEEIKLYVDAIEVDNDNVIGSTRNSYAGIEGSVTLGYPSTDENGNNLQAYYPLGETSGNIAVDVTDNKYDGTYIGATLGTSGILSQPSADFDGVDDGVNLPSGLDFTGESAMTVSCWFNVDSSVLGGSNTLNLVGDEANNTFILRWESGMFEFLINDGSTWHQDVGYKDYPTTGIWHHIAGVYDGSDIIFYYDGEEVDRRQGIDSTIGGNNNAAPCIGYRRAAGDRHWEGKIAHVRLYNRALTDDQVFNDLYDITKGYITTDSRLL